MRANYSTEGIERIMAPVRTGPEGTKYVRFTVDVWYQESDSSIHITSPDDPQFHTTVNNDPKSKRYHESLYKHLKRILRSAGRWPEGVE